MRFGLTGRTLAASGLLALVVAVAFGVLALAIGELRGSAAQSRRAAEVTAAANELERLVIDLQSGARGYILTGRERFLEPWKAAGARIPAQSDLLASLILDDEQLRRAREIDAAIEAYRQEFSEPLVALARRDREAARRQVLAGDGKRRVDALRARFSEFTAAGERVAEARAARVGGDARRAIGLATGGLGLSLLLVLLFAGYVQRAVVVPVRRLGATADRLAGGDLSARVPEGERAEVGDLGRAFNTMAASLEHSRTELEHQNLELELQASELEDKQAQLEAANDELEAQQAELHQANAQLGEEKERVEMLFGFARQIGAELDPEALASAALAVVAEAMDAEAGAAYVVADGRDEYVLTATRALDSQALSATVRAGEGLAGRALTEGRAVVADHGASGLRISALGGEVELRHELHVPLVHGTRCLGVLSLARLGDRAWSSHDTGMVEHLAEQASVALANALSYRVEQRLANVNRAVLDSTTDAIVMIDLEGNAVLRNAALERLTAELGFAEEGGDADFGEQIARAAERMKDPEGFRQAFAGILDDPRAVVVHDFELVDTGRSFYLESGPVRDADGEVLGRIFVMREVTAERQAERLKSELVATVSHELRTPLTGVLGFAELLSTRDLDEETRKRYLDTIYSEARRLTNLVSDFLDVQRIEAGEFTLALEPFDVSTLVRQKVELFSAQSSLHRLELELPDEPLVVLGERERVDQVLANVLSNAIKYSPGGGVVHVHAEHRNDTVRISVRDEGVGIPADQQAQIFAKFFRADSSDTRTIGGTGLGLALSREIIEAHGGRIGFESVEGEGSTFWFELPSGEAQASTRRILVVEDDAAAAALIADALALDGYATEIAITAEQALAAARANLPILVCLDIGLDGGLAGWEVLARLKGDALTAGVPVIVCTGGNGRTRAAAFGAADFLPKPFEPERLREAVARLIPHAHGTVLVADDDPRLRRLVVETLSREGLEVQEAADGTETLARIRERVPDVLVLDLVMPDIDGFGVLERLEGDARTRNLPVLVLTAKTLSAQERRALSERAISVLEKSAYSAERLRRLVRQAVGG